MLTYYLGDIHGRTLWKPLWASLPPNARLVILGDYFDSRDAIIPARQMANFEELLALRRQQPQRLTLLLGNHDYHYFSFASESYSGYQAGAASAIGLLLQQALQTADVQVAHAADGILATHAGVTQTWLMEWGGQPDDVATYLQELFTHKPHAFAFSPGP
ncbi:MAG TPA: metallophosphoesterase, partial [Phnomibacter sp.]|nr:metallophosphoesterase [Phnomibacter sp.]